MLIGGWNLVGREEPARRERVPEFLPVWLLAPSC